MKSIPGTGSSNGVKPRICVIGIGNEYRSDDGVGLLVARKLRKLHLPDVYVEDCRGESSELVETWKDADVAFVVDAVCTGAAVGTIVHFNAAEQRISSTEFRSSTHSLGIPESVELARVLGQLPDECHIYGIEGNNFEHGTELAPEMTCAADKVVEEILRTINLVSNEDGGEQR